MLETEASTITEVIDGSPSPDLIVKPVIFGMEAIRADPSSLQAIETGIVVTYAEEEEKYTS